MNRSYLTLMATIITNNEVQPNPEYLSWFCQDKLLFRALVGTLSPSLIPLITQSQTSKEAWQTLANTYARPSRGHIKQIKEQLKQTSKGFQSMSDYMQSIKTWIDQLAALGKPLDHEDLSEKILEGLDDDYQSIIDAVNTRDIPISFDELHEKLINKELSLYQKVNSTPLPTTANPTYSRFSGGNNKNQPSRPPKNPHTNNRDGMSTPCPFPGRCQWCRIQRHVVSQCLIFWQQNPHIQPPRPRPGNQWQP